MAARKLGLVLGGGGGKGSAHVGVLRVLEELQVEIDVVTGTSIGGIVGALVAAGYKAAVIEAAFREARLNRILGFDPTRMGLIGTTKIQGLMSDMLGNRRIEDLPRPFAAVTVDLISGREVHITSGRVIDAVLATSAVPGLFPPTKRDNRMLSDGGLFNNVPVDVALSLGADRTIAVDLIGAAKSFAPPEVGATFSIRRLLPLNQVQLAERAVELAIQRLTALRLQIMPPDLLLSPDVAAISMFEVTRVDDGIASGEAEARRYADKLVELREWRAASR